MKKIVKEAKTIEEAISKLEEEEKLTSNDYLYKKHVVKGSFLKSDSIKIEAYLKENILEDIKIYLKDIIKNLGLEISLEVRKNEERITINLISNNNPLLIGKNGQTLKALETMITQRVYSEYDLNYKVYLDVENYREKKDNRIIKLAKQTAKDVLKTKNSAILENLTSYERRLMHNSLAEFKGIKTHSEGDEPNRNLIIEIE